MHVYQYLIQKRTHDIRECFAAWIEICNGFVTRLRGALGLASSLERSPAPSLIGHVVHPDAVVAVVAFRGERPPQFGVRLVDGGLDTAAQNITLQNRRVGCVG